jgi:hypothetical protein
MAVREATRQGEHAVNRIIVSLVCLLLLSTVFQPEPAKAIPFYKNVFDGMYRARSGPKTTCAIFIPVSPSELEIGTVPLLLRSLASRMSETARLLSER